MQRYLIIAGGRKFNDYLLAVSSIDPIVEEILAAGDELTIVEGGAKGADRIGREYAQELGINYRTVEADWTSGPAAGPIRNRQMAEIGTDLIAFWDGESRGTKNMINEAEKRGLKTTVVRYN